MNLYIITYRSRNERKYSNSSATYQNRYRSPSYSKQQRDNAYSDNAFGDDMDGFAIDTTDVPSYYSRIILKY